MKPRRENCVGISHEVWQVVGASVCMYKRESQRAMFFVKQRISVSLG